MSNDLALIKGANSLVSPEERRARVLARVQALSQEGVSYTPFEGGTTYIKLDGNGGTLTYGRDAHEILATQQFVVPFEMASHGMRKWMNRKPTDERMIKVLDGPMPSMPTGPDEYMQGTFPSPNHRNGWVETIRLTFVGIGGDLDKVELQYDAANDSARGAANNLLAEMFAATRTTAGEEGFFNPIVNFSVDSYFNKTHDRDIYYPVFTIVGWTDGTTIRGLTEALPAGDAAGADFLAM